MNHIDRLRLTSRLRRLDNDKPPAIILGDGSTNDLSFVRSLTRHGIPTILMVGDRQLGSFSRRGLRLRLPNVDAKPQVWLDTLDVAASSFKAPPTLFIVSDAHCAFVSRNAERLRPGFRFLLPDEETVNQILDKRQQYAVAEAAGLRVPATLYPDDADDLARWAAKIDYPVILKPYTSHVGRPIIQNRKVLILDSAAELLAAYSQCTASGARFMVQHIVAGNDDSIFWYSGFWDEYGDERAWFTVQKLRQCPPGFGDGCFQRTVEDPVVLQQSRRVLAAFRYRGLVMVEFKRDVTNGTYNLIEINPRTVSGNQLGITAGVDLPWIAYRHLVGLDVDRAEQPAFQLNVKYVNEEWDVQAFWALRRSGESTFPGWLRSLWGTRSCALFAWDDPVPLLVGLWRWICACLQRLEQTRIAFWSNR